MEKLILENGEEFDLVANGVDSHSDHAIFTILPGALTAEQVSEKFTGNAKVVVKNGDVYMETFTNMIKCKSVKMQYDYFIDMQPACPECWKMLPSLELKECPFCQAKFENPDMVPNRGKVCFVEIAMPDINDRMTNAESAIESISVTMLSLTQAQAASEKAPETTPNA